MILLDIAAKSEGEEKAHLITLYNTIVKFRNINVTKMADLMDAACDLKEWLQSQE